MEIRWTRGAISDLLELGDFIARDNPAAATRVMRAIRDQVLSLKEQPRIGRRGRIAGTLELVHSRYPYIVAYRIIGENSEILAVRHTSRHWPHGLE
jgi:toxin ParE1/3/4